MAETHKWNKATKTGWKKENGKWVQYKKGKKTGVNKSNLYIGSRLVNTFKRTKRNIAAVEDLPSKSKGGGAANAATITKSNTKSKGSSKDQDDARKEAELSTYLKNKPKGGYSKSNTKDPGNGKTTGKKKKMHAIEKRNREIHGDTKVQALKDRHAAWKKARKEGTLAEWEKTHHPNRTPQYSKKKKKQNLKVESKKETPNAFNKKLKSKLTDKQVYKPTPNAYTTKFKSKLTDSKVYKKKKKKSFGEKLAASFD